MVAKFVNFSQNLDGVLLYLEALIGDFSCEKVPLFSVGAEALRWRRSRNAGVFWEGGFKGKSTTMEHLRQMVNTGDAAKTV